VGQVVISKSERSSLRPVRVFVGKTAVGILVRRNRRITVDVKEGEPFTLTLKPVMKKARTLVLEYKERAMRSVVIDGSEVIILNAADWGGEWI